MTFLHYFIGLFSSQCAAFDIPDPNIVFSFLSLSLFSRACLWIGTIYCSATILQLILELVRSPTLTVESVCSFYTAFTVHGVYIFELHLTRDF